MSADTPMTVLAIDDEEVILGNIAAFLEDSGYTVLKAPDGAAGLALFRERHPDAILVDLRMPGVDGLEVLASVTRESPDTPIIVVSGTGIIRDAIEAIHLGAWDFITKPIQDMAILEHAVQKALERARLRRENRMYHEHLEAEIVRRTEDLNVRSAELEESNQKLQKEMSERLLMEEQLIKAQKFESIGLFAGGIAHDFNNILTAILGNLSLALRYVRPEDRAHGIIASAEKATFRARDLTQQLQTFSRDGLVVRRPGSIKEIIKESAEFVMSGSNVKCSFYIPDDLWPVEIDASMISQVINNLIINAMQAMPNGGEVEVRAKNIEDIAIEGASTLARGRYIKVSVQDHGVGIPPGNLGRIFDPYFTTKSDGTGLGLAVIYSIIKKHDGDVSVQSQLGKGSTFSFFLPGSGRKADLTEAKEAKTWKGRGKVLVMDDEELVQETAGKLLEFMGYQPFFATHGQAVIEMYQHALQEGHPFVAVILNLIIPGKMGGKECMQKLREIDPGARGFASSGYAADPVMVSCERHGFCGAIRKPFRLEELGEALSRLP